MENNSEFNLERMRLVSLLGVNCNITCAIMLLRAIVWCFILHFEINVETQGVGI